MKKVCPDEELLADYLEGRLSDNERSKMEAHLSDCERCLDEFMVARNLVRGDDRSELDSAPSTITRAAVRLIHSQASLSSDTLQERFKQLIKDLYARMLDFFHLTSWGEWHLAPIRGSRRVVSKDLIHLKKTFKDMEAEIEIEKTGKEKTLIRVRSPKDIEQWKSVRVTLIKGEREITSHLLNQGSVLFEDIPFGHYSLTFSRDGVMLGKYLFKIKETRYGGRQK
jgi:hypothetical protein